jgi:hypothetical protein
MTIYWCPKEGYWSRDDCGCEGSKDSDEGHAAYEVDDPEATLVRLINLIGDTYEGLRDGDEVMDRLGDEYYAITGMFA